MEFQSLQNGINVSYLLEDLTEEIGEKGAATVLRHAQNILDKAPEPKLGPNQSLGLLYGLIQSGKTNIINMIISLAADNGYKLFILLTDNNNALQKQTYDRLHDSIETVFPYTISSLKKESLNMLQAVVQNEGIAIVCKKNVSDLQGLIEYIKLLNAQNLPTIIIDDEADVVGLNTNQRLENTSPSSINKYLVNLKSTFLLHLYLQVTATPQAILLQDNGNELSPSFIEVSEAGDGYVGIDTLFSDHKKNEYVKYINSKEIDILTDETNLFMDGYPETLLEALCYFLIGASIKITKEERFRRRRSKNELQFSFLIHISPLQTIHEKLNSLLLRFKSDVYEALSDTTDNEIKSKLHAAFLELSQFSDEKIHYPDLIATLKRYVKDYDVKMLNSSSETTLTDSKAKFLFIIGGNKLGRGLTIPRLLTTYYGRYTSAPKIDTISQHARMCGYREKDLDVTRVFVTEEIADWLRVISDHDKAQRKILKKKESHKVLYFDYNKIDPTRPAVIPNFVGVYSTGQIYMPKLPQYEKVNGIQTVTSNIDTELSNYCQESFEVVDIKTIIKLIELIPIKEEGSWKKDVIVSYLDWYVNHYNKQQGYLFYNIKGSKITRNLNRGIPSLLSEQMYAKVKNFNDSAPILVLYKIIGLKEKHWDGVDFWMPALRFPTDGMHLLFNLNNV
ncbi:Z1 domain-containing protein [Paenibacillus sp. GD4]|uniref:Z1 domain-containing protein n=1 Tax=Paenibacillus sp. GD4 TaxID=3068890 RepID=UPI002796BCE7|nr:Z1 domain-containing protein [Paenibacillus sp. GD4]MDQ1910552.1 Z1 domain-containing protein [Paenibacillus sp. GD4]